MTDEFNKNSQDPLCGTNPQSENGSEKSEKELSSEEAPDTEKTAHEPLNPPMNRRDLVTTVPKVALGTLLAMEGDKGLANPYLLMMMRGSPPQAPTGEVYGLWAFGQNVYGQLGLGDRADRSSNHEKMSPQCMKVLAAA